MKLKFVVSTLLGGLGVVGAGLYRSRRRLLAHRLGLPPVLNEVTIRRNIPVPADDGVRLMTDHYAPRPAKGQAQNQKYPTILIRTPYGRGFDAPFGLGIMWVLLAQRFAERGYNVLIQTTRGRFDSEGEFRPRQTERRDGLATLEWLSRQSWFNGQVGTWGQSYLGFVQWAIGDAPLIKALVPGITSSRSYQVTYPDEVFDLDRALNWSYGIYNLGGPVRQPLWKTLRRLNATNRQKILSQAFMHLPLKEADKVAVGQEVPYYQNWLKNPHPDDPYWEKSDNSGVVPHITAPVHLISGWYDFMLRELLLDYQTLKEAGRNPYLTIGPWWHVHPGGFLENLRAGINWFDVQLKGNKSRLRPHPVRYYVMGADEWREGESWPPPSRETRYFLQEKGGLSTEMPAVASKPDHYRYDPANPTPAVGGTLLTAAGGPVDNRELEARPDVVIYSTLPLESEVEINGWVKLELFVKSSLEYTDFFGRLCDVYPDGRSLNVCDGLFRIAPGKGELQPDGSLKIRVDLWATAQRFKRGHRIRLQVSSGAHPRWNRNLGTGEDFATSTCLQAADQTVYHDTEHPSALLLPVVSGS
jgi:putative CocE/NonD family hydrolase